MKKIVTIGKTKFEVSLVDGEIKEHDFVMSVNQFERMNENGKYFNPVVGTEFDIDIEPVKTNSEGLIAICYSGNALQKLCKKVIIDLI